MKYYLLFFILLSNILIAAEFSEVRVEDNELVWKEVDDGVWIADISGNENIEGMYVRRIKLAKGIKSDRHYHHDVKVGTILSGSLYVGFMAKDGSWSEKKLGPGGVYTEPNNLPHYVWSKDEDVVVQIVGYGPTSRISVKHDEHKH